MDDARVLAAARVVAEESRKIESLQADVAAAKAERNTATERVRAAEDALDKAMRSDLTHNMLWDAVLDREPVEAQQSVSS